MSSKSGVNRSLVGDDRGSLGSRVDWNRCIGTGLGSLASSAHNSGSSKQNGKKELHGDRRDEFQMFKNGCEKARLGTCQETKEQGICSKE